MPLTSPRDPCLPIRPYLGESGVKLSYPSIPRGPQASQGPQAPQGAPSTPGGPKHSRGPQAPQGAPSTPGGPKYPRGTPRHGNLGQSSRSLCPWALHDGCPELYSVKGSSQVLYAQCAKKKFGCTCPSDIVKQTLTCPNHNLACPKNLTFAVHVCVMDSCLSYKNGLKLRSLIL